MSNKVQTFAGIITNPMNVHNFEIVIPDIDSSIPLLVESTTYPAQGQYRDVVLWAHGEKVVYPGLPENGGTWTIKIPESDNGKIAKAFHELSAKLYDQASGVMQTPKFRDIEVYAKDLAGNTTYHVILHHAWLKQRQPANLNAATPEAAWKWDYVFYYNWIEDKFDK